jgi:hypothetical protein
VKGQFATGSLDPKNHRASPWQPSFTSSDDLHQLESGLVWTPQIAELLEGTETTSNVEGASLSVTGVRTGGAESLHLQEFDTVSSE